MASVRLVRIFGRDSPQIRQEKRRRRFRRPGGSTVSRGQAREMFLDSLPTSQEIRSTAGFRGKGGRQRQARLRDRLERRTGKRLHSPGVSDPVLFFEADKPKASGSRRGRQTRSRRRSRTSGIRKVSRRTRRRR